MRNATFADSEASQSGVINAAELPRRFRIPLRNRAHGLHWLWAPVVLEEDWLTWCDGVLSGEEKQRAANYAFAWLSAHYRASRGALRHALGEFIGMPPAQLMFQRGQFGKPSLENVRCAFNFSDSGNYWAACMHRSTGVEAGIDIEATARFNNAGAGLVDAMLSSEERAAWHQRPPKFAAAALVTVWTRKEAVLKALGTGLSIPMRGINVGWDADPRPVALPNATGAIEHWYLHDLPALPRGLVGCVAINAE